MSEENKPRDETKCPCPHCREGRTNTIHQNPNRKAEAIFLKGWVEWQHFPKLSEIFEDRPASNNYWHELVQFVIHAADILGTDNRRKKGNDHE